MSASVTVPTSLPAIDPEDLVPKSIFAFDEDVDSTTVMSDMMGGVVPEGMFAAGKYVLRATYTGVFAANDNAKFFEYAIGSTAVFADEVDRNSGAWRLEVLAMRDGTDSLRVFTRLSFGTYIEEQDEPVTGVDFDDLINFRLRGSSDDAADFTARSGFAERIAAPADAPDGLTYIVDDDGAFVVDDDDSYVTD